MLSLVLLTQLGTPDLDMNDSETAPGDPFARLARRLHVNERAPVHWDDADLDRMLVMRPLENETCMRCAVGDSPPGSAGCRHTTHLPGRKKPGARCCLHVSSMLT